MGRRGMYIGYWWEIKEERKRQLGTPRRRWVDNVKVDFRELGWSGMGWIDLVQDRYRWRALMNTVMKARRKETTRKAKT
jgi:hypothetical protein